MSEDELIEKILEAKDDLIDIENEMDKKGIEHDNMSIAINNLEIQIQELRAKETI